MNDSFEGDDDMDEDETITDISQPKRKIERNEKYDKRKMC